jgi:hypothetical protein
MLCQQVDAASNTIVTFQAWRVFFARRYNSIGSGFTCASCYTRNAMPCFALGLDVLLVAFANKVYKA